MLIYMAKNTTLYVDFSFGLRSRIVGYALKILTPVLKEFRIRLTFAGIKKMQKKILKVSLKLIRICFPLFCHRVWLF